MSVNFETADRSVCQSAMKAIRDFAGNFLGGGGAWLRIGSAGVNGDGDVDQILVNLLIGRFATVGTTPGGLACFLDLERFPPICARSWRSTATSATPTSSRSGR